MKNKIFDSNFVPLFSYSGLQDITYPSRMEEDKNIFFFKGSASGGETIEAKRRRQSSGPSGRAEAPSQRRAEDEETRPPSGGSGGVPSFGGAPSLGGGKKLSGCATIIIIVFIIAYYLIFGNQGQTGTQQTASEEAPVLLQPTQEPEEELLVEPTLAVPQPSGTRPSISTGGAKTWTVMLYQDADDQILEQDILLDLNEAERVGSTERINIVAQLDRYRGAYQGDQNWTSARRYFVTQDNDLKRIRSQVIEDLGEVNMADSQTLVDFVTWAIKTYPADKYALILSDHGMGWPGGWSDQDSKVERSSKIPLVKVAGNQMYLMEIDQALGEVRNQTGVDKFEFVGMDACLMADVAVFSALAPHARYAVASQETEPGLGWAYTGFLQSLASNPDVSGAELGKQIVESYIDEDQRIVDDQARAEFLRQGSPMGGLFGVSDIGAKALARQVERGVTLTAVDLNAMPTMLDSINKLSYALQTEDQSKIARARTYAQSFTSVFGDNVPPSYIDLGNFTSILLQEGSNAEVQNAAKQVQGSIRNFVIAEKHGSGKPGASGVSIYFPNSKLFKLPATGPASYTAIARRFAEEALWDDFLAYHYTQRPFEPAAAEAVQPDETLPLRAPGKGTIKVSALSLSSKKAAPDQPISMSAKLTGKNIGYVYLFVGYIDQASNAIMVADIDYLESPETQEVNGVYYPKWSDNKSFTLKYEWNPTVFAISDGQQTIPAVLNPERYGATSAEAVYTVDGYFTSASSGDARFAKLYFREEKLQQVFGFSGDSQTGAPHEIIPETGDSFTILERWLEADSSGTLPEDFKETKQRGGTLTFTADMFTWKELYAAAGDYVVGFIVTDLDGNSKQTYNKVTVQ